MMSKHSKLLDLLIKYAMAAILIAVPLYPKFPFIKIPGTFVSIRLEDTLLLFASFLLIVIYLPKGAGLHLRMLDIDYSFSRFAADETLGNTHRISLRFVLQHEQFG